MMVTRYPLISSLAIALCAQLASVEIHADSVLVFGNAVPLPHQTYSGNAVVADLNGDGKLDILVGEYFSDPMLFLNNGTSTPFLGVPGTPISTGNQQQEVYVADMNGDQHPDVVAIGPNGPTKLYLNNGTVDPFHGVSPTDINPGSTDASVSAAIGDVNADGHPDLVLVNTNHQGNRVILNNGTSQPFAGASVKNIGTENGYPSSAALVDANEDGRMDLIMIFTSIGSTSDPRGGYLYLNNGTNDPFNGVTPTLLVNDHGVEAVAVADLNGDGHQDILVASVGTDSNVFLLHTGVKTHPYGAPVHFPISNAHSLCGAIAVYDINGDNKPDVAFGCYDTSSAKPLTSGAIYLNNGTADPFSDALASDIPWYEGARYTRSAQFADLAGDGKLSLVEAEDLAYVLPMYLDSRPSLVDDRFAMSVNQSVEADVLANDIDAGGSIDRSSIELSVYPAHGVATINASKGTISYQPNVGFIGDDEFAYTAKDQEGVKSNTAATVKLHIQGHPFADNDAAAAVSGGLVDIDVLHNDTVAGGTLDPASVTITLAPSHGTATVSQGKISYQSTAGFVGTDVLQYTVKDNLGVTSPNASVTLAVSAGPTSSTTTPTTTSTGGKKGGGGATDAMLIVAASILIARRRRTRFCDAAKGWRPNS
jgi:hypothetical protein